MRSYRSQKIVQAGRIVSIDKAANIVTVDDNEPVEVTALLFAFGDPAVGDFLIRSPRGALSWTPARAFEEGYTVVDSLLNQAVEHLRGQDKQAPFAS